MTVPPFNAGLTSARSAVDLWTGKQVDIDGDQITAVVAGHGSLLLRVDEPDRFTR